MTDDNRISQVTILIQQSKYAEAEHLLKDLLTWDANNSTFLSLFAEVNLQQDKFEIARTAIENAIGLSPDAPHLFYIKSRIAIQEDNFDLAENCIRQSIELDPADADYFALYANIKLSRKQYHEALRLSDKALELDAENILGLNTRSTALLKLNKKEDSFVTIQGALREDPNNAFTHANYGWGLLERGDHKKALEHFKEALQNDPTLEFAQSGLLEALKATNPVYRLFLRYAFFMGNLTAKYQWGFIIGFYLGMQALKGIARKNEALQPYLYPLILALALVAFSTWVMEPIGNLFLRFNKYGQLLLNEKEKISSNFVAGSFGLFVLGILLYVLLKDDAYLSLIVYGFGMMLPFGSMFSPSKHKNSLLIYTIAMASVGLGAVVQTLFTGEIFNFLTVIFILGFVAFQWIANYLLIKETNR